ncbi:MAG: prolyl oligopeptidase family serine peptidase, partial [Sedimentisphaerales bacterium]|nr:prolyl oligopeptidase family serine peptidase [Sedimentisphaerales bacterium]
MKAIRMGLLAGLCLSVAVVWAEEKNMKDKEAAKQQAMKLNRPVTLKIDYLLHLPAEYDKKAQWPLMIFLHGAGERGSDLNKVKVHGPPKLIEQGKELPFIVVSPQCPTGQWWTNKVETIMALIDEIVEKYNVDQSRIYLTGLSMGGFGTWAIASAYPERFAAIVPICGGGQ